MNATRNLVLMLAFILGAAKSPGVAQDLGSYGPKFGWFQEHKDDYDIIFSGSSRIYHGISPKLFDQIGAAHGQHWHSFNLSKDSMAQPKCLSLVRQVVALRPRRLRYVFLELQITGANAPDSGQDSTGSLLANNNGPHHGLGPDDDGFFPLARNMSNEMRPIYEQRLAAEKANPVARQLNVAVRDDVARFCAELKAQKIEVVFIVAPSLRSARGAGVNAPPGYLLFAFDDLSHYAALYDEANRPDAEHLNGRGAVIFTRLVANDFLQALAPRKP